MKPSLWFFLLTVILTVACCVRLPAPPPEALKNANYGRAPTKEEIAAAAKQFAAMSDSQYHTTYSEQRFRPSSPIKGYVALHQKDGGHKFEFGHLVYLRFNNPSHEHILMLRDGKLVYAKPALGRSRPKQTEGSGHK